MHSHPQETAGTGDAQNLWLDGANASECAVHADVCVPLGPVARSRFAGGFS